jgi:2,3-diaminopropionate biosynthesis protein SbnA
VAVGKLQPYFKLYSGSMMIIQSLSEISAPPLFYRAEHFLKSCHFYIKLEGLNISGSIKIKPAIWLVESLERSGKLIPGKSVVVCSTSGSLGIALSIVCKQKNYRFICVSDPNISAISERYILMYGGQLIKVTERDGNDGFLGTRLRLIAKITQENSDHVFVDQYDNEENVNAHFFTTGQEILNQFPTLDYLFIGAGTTGTLMGCAKLFRSLSPNTKIIAVDAVGSVTFGFAPGRRSIPGLGTSFKPQIAKREMVDDIVIINEADTVQRCHQILRDYGLFLGGSSGTVLEGVQRWSHHIKPGSTVVAISPDFGDRYLNTIYNPEWVAERFPQLTNAVEMA